MRVHCLVLALLGTFPGPGLLAQSSDVQEGLAAIDEARIKADVIELSSNAFMGRSCPTPGYMRAAAYMEARFRELGLEPGGSDPKGEHPYFRYWEQEASVPAASSSLTLELSGELQSFQLEKDWIPLFGSEAGSFAGELAFVGYAIDASKWRYKDFGSVNLKGKLAIAFWHEPRENDKGTRFDGLEWTEHASARQKAKLAKERGALALILVHDPLHEPLDQPPLFQFPRFDGWNGGPRDEPPDFPVIFVSLQAGSKLTGLDLGALHAEIDKSFKGMGLELPGRQVELEIGFERKQIQVPNVIGVAKGTRSAANSVVVAAHLDHAGADDGGRIWNGADDNASGSAALLAIAAAFAKAPAQRDTVLIAMAAEEWGLWGSEAYAKDPHVSLDRTDFMLNVDMVGRGKTKEIAVMGAWESPELIKIIKNASRLVGGKLKLDTHGGREYWKRSDQYNFFKHGVPALFVSEVGIEHEDYHRPSDTSDKIDTKKATYAAKLAYAIAWIVGEEPEPLPRIKASER